MVAPTPARPSIILVEDSRTFTAVLSFRLRAELDVDVTVCSTLHEFREAVFNAPGVFTLAIVDLNLIDSPKGEVLTFALEANMPTIVFTGTFDFNTREIILKKNVIDYVIKDNDRVFDTLVASVKRILDNRNIGVLVVEQGSGEGRSEVVDLLKAQQFLVYHATTPAAAIECLTTNPGIELALIDHALDSGNGVDLVRALRRDANPEQLRIIGFSSKDNAFLSAAFLKAGANDFLYRPFLQEEFQCRVAQNVETLIQMKNLRAIASKDFLTDLYNRRHFFERGPAIVKNSLARGETCCVAVLDIDHFKKFNDTYGHETGDLVLKVVARKMREIVGHEPHLAARLGGEEFVILLRNMAVKEATEYCDIFRDEVSKARIVFEEEELSVTCSMGVAQVFADETFDNYLNAADQYLYMAKNSGRNRVFSDYSITQLFASRA